jgi:hypothetical protein
MSISQKNREKKLKMKAWEVVIVGYKKRVNDGEHYLNFDYNIFGDDKEEFKNFMMRYWKIKNVNKEDGLFE